MEARLTLDRTPFNDELRIARADADKLARDGITVPVNADPAKADARLDELKRKKPEVKGSVDLDTKAANAKLDALKAKADKTIGGNVAAKLGEAPAWLGPALLALPAAMTVLGTATGAAAALGSTLAAGGIAFAAYGAVARSVIGQAATASTAVSAAQAKYNAAIAAGTKMATAYKAEQQAILLAYHGMSPAQIALSKQLGDLSADWQKVEKSVTPVIAMSVRPWLAGITSGLGFVRPVIGDVSQEVGSLGQSFDALVNLPSFATFARFIGTEGSEVVGTGGGAILNFFQGFVTLLPLVRPLIADVDTGIEDLGTSFLGWAQSDAPRHDLQQFLAWLHANGPEVGQFIASIAKALGNVGSGLLEGSAGQDEIRLLTGFFSLIAGLPPSFVQPVSDLAASLLIISKFSFGRKIISIGVNWVGGGIAALLKLLSGGKIDIAGKFGASAGMQKAADTMVEAAGAMQKAADTMVEADEGAGADGAAAAAAGAESGGAGAAAGEAGAAAAGSESGVAGIVAGVLSKFNPALLGLGLAGDTSQPQQPDASTIAGLLRRIDVFAGQTTTQALTTQSSRNASPLPPSEAAKVVALSQSGDKAAIAAMGLDPNVIAQVLKYTSAADDLTAKVRSLNTAFIAGHGASSQFTGDLTGFGTTSQKARTLTDEYTLAIQRNAATSQGAHQIRAQIVADFENQGLSARQASQLVDNYTDGVARDGDTATAKAQARAQLIKDFIASGDTAQQAASQVDALIRKMAGVHSKTVDLSVQASGSYTITGQSVAAGASHRFQGGVAAGGLIRGPGSGTSDTAGLYALSNKEFVHNAAAVAHYGTAFMHAVNNRMLPKMAAGGLAGAYSGSASGLGAFDVREYAATQSLIQSADASAAASAIAKAVAAVQARIDASLGPANLRQIESWWTGAGGPGGNTARIAAAITGAESGFRVGAVQQGQPYATTGWGLWQITPGDSEPQAGINDQLLSGPSNAVAAVAKYRGAGGFSPWTTYEDGAYLQFMGGGSSLNEVRPRSFDGGAGYLPPGMSLAWNGTGGPEQLQRVTPGSGGAVPSALMRDIYITPPDGATVASALREMTYQLRVARQQVNAGVFP